MIAQITSFTSVVTNRRGGEADPFLAGALSFAIIAGLTNGAGAILVFLVIDLLLRREERKSAENAVPIPPVEER